MALFPKNPNEALFPGGKKHFLEVIKNEGGPRDLFYLNPQEDFNTGSVLIVSEGEVALFCRDGVIVQEFSAGRYELETSNYPFISRLFNSVSGGVSSFSCRVLFIRLEDSEPIRWGTRTPVQVFDPQMGSPANIRAYGSYVIRVTDAATLYRKLVGNNVRSMSVGYVRQQLEDVVGQEIMGAITSVMGAQAAQGRSIIDVCSHAAEMAGLVEQPVADELSRYGLALQRFSISGLSVPPDDPYLQLVHKRAEQRAEQGVDIVDRAVAQSQAMGAFAAVQPNQAWQAQQSVNIMGQIAQNSGGDVAAAAAGLGVGLGAMGAVDTMSNQIAFGAMGGAPGMAAPAAAPAPAPAAQPTPVPAPAAQPTPAPAPAAAQCPKCGNPLPPTAKFCPECGTPAPRDRHCPQCGSRVADGAKFCPECGTKLEG